jgi:hypothetical protein
MRTKDIRRLFLLRFFRIWRQVFAINEPSEREFARIGSLGRVENDRGRRCLGMVGRPDDGHSGARFRATIIWAFASYLIGTAESRLTYG